MNQKNTPDESQCNPVSRRQFIQRTAAMAAPFIIVPRYVLGGVGHTPPSE